MGGRCTESARRKSKSVAGTGVLSWRASHQDSNNAPNYRDEKYKRLLHFSQHLGKPQVIEEDRWSEHLRNSLHGFISDGAGSK